MDICCDIEKMSLLAGDVCLVSVPSFAGRVPQIAVERLKKISGNGAKAILNCVYGFRDREYFKLKIYQLPEISSTKEI